MSWDMFGGVGAPASDPEHRTRDFPPTPEFPMPMPDMDYSSYSAAHFGAVSAPPPSMASSSSYAPSYSPWGFDTSDPPPPPLSVPPIVGGVRGPMTFGVSHSTHLQSSHQLHTQSATHLHHHSSSSRPVHQHINPQGHLAVSNPAQSSEPHFQYSKCTGRRKAVCVGINYRQQPYELFGCVNDAKNVYRFLKARHHFKEDDMILLVDDTRNPRQSPTRKNILDAMRWLVKDAQPNDSLFFHYSGHGGQVKDRDGDEIDGWDEVIYPLDYQKAGSIVDDLMHAIMVRPLPTGCRLTALFDSCHSGSILDLPYLYHTNGRMKGSQVKSSHIKAKATPADVISWSGCKDSQKSADTFEGGAAAGAMSYAFMNSLTLQPHQTYQDLLRSVRDILKKNYSQKPQLSSSHRIDTNLQFII